ncbi:MAG: hypothetical protein RLZZ527_605 [Actinomycetota bacterium]
MAFPDLTEIRSEIDEELRAFVSARSAELRQIDEHLTPVAAALSDYILDGGKRFRPIFAYLGYLGAGGILGRSAIKACTALELVHVCALIHDDLMDGSDSRRNQPSIHRRFENQHRMAKHSGSGERFGAAAAILLGDLALSWSDQLLHSSADEIDLTQALSVFHKMREELMAGQYLDVLEGALGKSETSRSFKIAEFKSGKYSIERPLQFGAALAGKLADFHNVYSRFGIPLGVAFQLRDDLLGVFGDEKITGKPSGDDIREGKRTVLVAIAQDRLAPAEQAELESLLGNPALTRSEISRAQHLITASGAASECELLIETRFQDAIAALNHESLPLEVTKSLVAMAQMATKRSS